MQASKPESTCDQLVNWGQNPIIRSQNASHSQALARPVDWVSDLQPGFDLRLPQRLNPCHIFDENPLAFQKPLPAS